AAHGRRARTRAPGSRATVDRRRSERTRLSLRSRGDGRGAGMGVVGAVGRLATAATDERVAVISAVRPGRYTPSFCRFGTTFSYSVTPAMSRPALKPKVISGPMLMPPDG